MPQDSRPVAQRHRNKMVIGPVTLLPDLRSAQAERLRFGIFPLYAEIAKKGVMKTKEPGEAKDNAF